MNCDVCGIEMTADILSEEAGIRYKVGIKNIAAVGVCISCIGNHPEFDRLERIFGKTKFHICFVCYLKSLGVNPINE